MDSSLFDPESSSSLAEDATSADSLSPSPTNDASYQDIYDDPRPNAPRQFNHAQSPSEVVVNNLPDLSVRAPVGSRSSTAALAQGPDGSRVVVAGKDTLRILRIEDAEVPPPTGYMNFSPTPSPLTTHAEATNAPGQRNSRSYAAAAAPDGSEGLGASKFIQKGRRVGKSLSRYAGPNESAVYDETNLWSGVGAKLGFQSSIVDVEWSHQGFSNVIITAFGAGELVSWDLNKSSGSKVDRCIRDAHMRAINCIHISPTNGFALLTASQDGFVKYWDLRNFKSPSVQIPHHGTAVRALAFSPGFETAQALVGLEIGVLLRYDLRKPRTALDRLPIAHSSAILSIDWQSVGNGNTSGWAATAGMDKTVKIWDTSTPQMSTQPMHTLHTTHPVKQAAWRPGHETELAIVHLTPGISPQKANALAGTTSLGGIDMGLQIHAHGAKTPMLSSSPASHYAIRGPHHRQRALSHSESIVPSTSAENLTLLGSAAQLPSAYDGDADRIEIWDVRRSWVAKYVLSDNISDGPVTELIWPSGGARPGGALWVAYTSGTFAQHDLRNVFRPLDSVPRSGVTWETRGVVAFAVDAVERGEIPYDDVRPDARNLFTTRGGKDKAVSDPPYAPRTQVKGSVPIPSFEPGVFVKLARGYILGGGEDSREDICLHNAQVALEANQYRASQAWHLLRSLLTPLVPEGPVALHLEVATEYASGRSHPVNLPSTHTSSPRSGQGSRAPSAGPAYGSLQRKSESPRHRYPSGRRRPISRRASRGSASGSSHSHSHSNSLSHGRPTNRSRSVSVDSNSSLKHVGGGALDDESDSSDGDIAESESEDARPRPKATPSPSGPSGISLVRPYTSPLRRIRNTDIASTSLLSAPNEADEHDLSLMGAGGSSDEHLPTDSEPLHNSPTSDVEISEDGESDTYGDGDAGPNITSLATLKPETIRPHLVRRQDSRSSIGTAKPSLRASDSQTHIRPALGAGARRVSPATSRTHSLTTHRNRMVSDPLRSGKTTNMTLFPDRGRSRKPRRDVSEAEEKYRQMGWEAMRETVAYYSDRGDLQMSAMLSSIGGPELGIPPEAHERLVDAYLDLLSRLRLYAPAAYVRKYAKSRYACQASTLNTIIYSACTRCGKALTKANPTKEPLSGQYAFCGKCKRFASQCSICRLPVRGLYFMCSECTHGGHQECYRSYYLSRPLVNLDGSSTTANSRTNTILESDTRSAANSVLSLTSTDPDKSTDDGSSVKTEKTLDMSTTDLSNRNSLEITGQESRGSADWTPRGHPCAAGCGHFCWASNDRGLSEVQ